MLKKTIAYTDYNGRERKENFYFNLSLDELMDMELGTVGGMQQMLQQMSDKQDMPKFLDTFKSIILKSYGEKSADGRRFIKSPELSEAFKQTGAYTSLYMELISDANAAAEFVNRIVPADLADAVARIKAEDNEVADAKMGEAAEAVPAEEPADEGPKDASLSVVK